jgi:hypothetical protein
VKKSARRFACRCELARAQMKKRFERRARAGCVAGDYVDILHKQAKQLVGFGLLCGELLYQGRVFVFCGWRLERRRRAQRCAMPLRWRRSYHRR